MKDLSKTYNPTEFEKTLYDKWEASGAFKPKGKGVPFSMVLPPPNVTGSLHVGHAVVVAIEDLMVRYHRMKGDKTLWIPGVDHAAIATQNVVEKKIRKEKDLTRHQLGRKAFLKEVEAFVETTKVRILTQIRSLGASLDWSCLAYTMDEDRSLAVKTIFKQMYDAGILYRGNRIVNWCPRCQSTLADDEVEYRAEKTPFYYFKFGPVVIGTARPETKFLDKTIIVHPNDKRYLDIVDRSLEVEWIEGKIKANVIADKIVDPEFGTGAMTITPAHSFEDFELAQKYNLPVSIIIDERGKLTEAAGKFAGQKARDAREGIVAKLKSKGLVDHIDKDYIHNLSVCYRCGTPIEPMPKLQWFVDVNKKFRNGKSLKDLMREAVGKSNNQIKIIPDRFEKTYFHWIDNLRDWCISRQIWFGHQLPVWYRQVEGKNQKTKDKSNQETYVGIEPPKGKGWTQDPDTLDTWFSSGTWTFSTLGWPKDPDALKEFHPTSVLETGYDILFFWVARMILMSQFALNEIPFKTVYLHGLVRDKDRQKMSKSKGNVVDPLGIINQYGADALRMALIFGTGIGSDIIISEDKVRGMRNFATKLWNVSRFILMNLGDSDLIKEPIAITEDDKEIFWKLNADPQGIIWNINQALDKYRFHLAADQIYDFIWNHFASIYIEKSKSQLQDQKLADNTRAILLHVLKQSVTLLHPFMPFVTEAIWQELPKSKNDSDLLITQPWPSVENRG